MFDKGKFLFNVFFKKKDDDREKLEKSNVIN